MTQGLREGDENEIESSRAARRDRPDLVSVNPLSKLILVRDEEMIAATWCQASA
jgi:hypothetical protein